MSKGLDALKELYGAIRCENSHNLEACSVLRETIEKELKEYEMEHTLRVRLENINYELVREKQENEKVLEILLNKIIGDKDYFLLVAKNCGLTEDEINIVLERLENESNTN